MEDEDCADMFTNTEFGRKIIPYKAAELIYSKVPMITTDDNETMYYYDNGIYKTGAESVVKRIIQEKALKEVKLITLKEIIGHIQRSTFIKREMIGANRKHLHLKNGILDTETLQVMPFNEEEISIVQLPVNYDINADCPLFKKFLSEILPEETDRLCVQEIFGYFLHPDYNHHKAFMFLGEGANGKSTLISVMRAFLGNENISAVQLQDMEENQFMAAQLYGKIANLYPDMSANALKQTSTFKALCGGDMIMVDSKFGKPFQFVNHAKLVFSCNALPEIKNPSPADFRRWIVIQFKQTFEGVKDDKHLLKKLITEQELSGILNWALIGLKRLLDNDCFTYNRSMEEMQIIYTRYSNPVGCFIMDAIVEDSEGAIPKEVLWREFLCHAKDIKLRSMSEVAFWMELKKEIPFVWEERPNTQDRKRVIKGISFSSTYVQHVQHLPIELKYLEKISTIAKELVPGRNSDSSTLKVEDFGDVQ